VYLWSDDNLSNDYFFRHLSGADIELIQNYRNYGKVCCFKGFDHESFSFNTSAEPQFFDQQFELFRRYLQLGIDLYAYTTFTAPSAKNLPKSMIQFVDRLQKLHPNLPLRTVPLEIKAFGPVHSRVKADHQKAMAVQQDAIKCWNEEIERRFSSDVRKRAIYDVQL
jgi:hypothetical protein